MRLLLKLLGPDRTEAGRVGHQDIRAPQQPQLQDCPALLQLLYSRARVSGFPLALTVGPPAILKILCKGVGRRPQLQNHNLPK